MSDIKKKAADFVAEIQQEELALRICEGVLGMKRPEGKTAEECFEAMPEENRIEFMRAAENALLYFSECIQKGQRTS